MKMLSVVLTLSFCLLTLSHPSWGQICSKYPCIIGSSESGEVASAAIDNLLAAAVRSDERIFVIARLGKGETKTGLNLGRLCEARDTFPGPSSLTDPHRKYFNLLPPVFAEGPGIEGEGRLEFYFGSKLHLVRMIKRNMEANLDCCGELTRSERRERDKECRNWKKTGVSNIGKK